MNRRVGRSDIDDVDDLDVLDTYDWHDDPWDNSLGVSEVEQLRTPDAHRQVGRLRRAAAGQPADHRGRVLRLVVHPSGQRPGCRRAADRVHHHGGRDARAGQRAARGRGLHRERRASSATTPATTVASRSCPGSTASRPAITSATCSPCSARRPARRSSTSPSPRASRCGRWPSGSPPSSRTSMPRRSSRRPTIRPSRRCSARPAQRSWRACCSRRRTACTTPTASGRS